MTDKDDDAFEKWLAFVNDTVMRELRYFTLDADHNLVPCHNILEWGRFLESDDRIVAGAGNDDLFVSTVFLGIDHGFGGPPLLFETMVFRDGHGTDDYTERYSSWKAAEAGHKRICAKVFKRAGVK